jgi:hypothetical protein
VWGVLVNVLVIAEDFVKDQHLLQPIIEAMVRALGMGRPRVRICRDPRFHGTSEALQWEHVERVVDRYRYRFELFLLCVDRDGNQTRRAVLDHLESRAQAKLSSGGLFLAENAWQEVEVWLLMGHDLPAGWDWRKIRAEPHPKEQYYVRFAQERGVAHLVGEGRQKLAREAAGRYPRIRQRCREDVQNLETRIKAWLEQRA